MLALKRHWPLLASIALNLFLAGALFPRLIFGPPPPGPPGVPGPELLRRMTGEMSESDARILHEALAPGEEFREMREHFARERERLDAIVRQEPFDAKAFQAALAAGTEMRSKVEIRRHEALAGALSRISAEGRAKFARMPKPPPPGAPGFGR